MTRITLVCLAVVLCAVSGSPALDDSLEVQTAQGPVRGYRHPEGSAFVFYGIPYATAPMGKDKFKAPLVAPSWSYTFEAVKRGIKCPQPKHSFARFGFTRPEQGSTIKIDCLVLNVVVPDTNKTNLPVVVYVHGGAYQLGRGETSYSLPIVEEGEIVAVNFNYRLGVHGFLCLGTDKAPGNAGMKDMIAALKWVQTNIANFGGNPHDVTIDGFSSGAAAVDTLALSKLSAGLFHKVIPESGTAISSWGVQIDPLKHAFDYAKLLNFTGSSVSELEEFYTSTPIDILASIAILHSPDNELPFVPCIERNVGAEVFLDEAPIDIYKRGDYIKRPFLLGFSKMEGMMRLKIFDQWKDRMNQKFSDFLPEDLTFKDDSEKESVAKKVKEYYFGDKPVGPETVQEYINFLGDTAFAYPVLRSVQLQVAAGSDSIFLYEYAFADTSSSGDGTEVPGAGRITGANHCAQTFAIFGPDNNEKDSNDFKRVKNTLRHFWINFIKSGRPLAGPSEEHPSGWAPTRDNGAPFMLIDNVTEIKPILIPERARFWDEIYEKFYKKPTPPPEPK